MMDRSGERCVLCSEPSSKTGEHVLPKWLSRRLFPTDDTYIASRNGIQLGPTTNNIGRVTVPMCRQCNRRLSLRFEHVSHGSRETIAELFRGDTKVLSPSEAAWFRTWVLKTWILAGHPARRLSAMRTEESRGGAEVPHHWLNWLSSESMAPPTGLWAWVQRTQPKSVPIGSSAETIELATVKIGDTGVDPLISTFGLSGLTVHVVGQFLHPVEHPLVRIGEAVQIYPGSDSIDLAGLSQPGRLIRWAASMRLIYDDHPGPDPPHLPPNDVWVLPTYGAEVRHVATDASR